MIEIKILMIRQRYEILHCNFNSSHRFECLSHNHDFLSHNSAFLKPHNYDSFILEFGLFLDFFLFSCFDYHISIYYLMKFYFLTNDFDLLFHNFDFLC